MLGAVPGHPVEFCFSDLKLTTVQGHQCLYRTLTEGLSPDHQTPLVVLNRSCENFGCGGGKSIDQYREWTIPRRPTVLITIDSRAWPTRFSHLNRGARRNK